MRKAIVVGSLALLVLAYASIAAPVEKQTDHAAGGGEHRMVGEVTRVDPPDRTFTLKETLKGGAAKRVLFRLAEDGHVMVRGKAAALDDMKPGDSVTVKYVEEDGKKIARTCDVAKPAAKAP